MKNPYLSIVVPVYNMEQYLEKCIESILAQSFKDFELILIDDCSTDRSKEIIESYKNNNNIICIYNKKNNGQGLVKNNGIKMATGTYIGFVDPDDYVDKEMYAEMIEDAQRNNSDIVECNIEFKDGNFKTTKLKEMPRHFNTETDGVENYILNIYKKRLSASSCNKIYKSEILKKNNILFNDNKKVSSEDLLFNVSLIYDVNKITAIDRPFYHYISRQDSTTHLFKTYEWAKNEKLLDLYVQKNKNRINFKNCFFNFSLLIIPLASNSLSNCLWNTNRPFRSSVDLLKTMSKNTNFNLVIKNNLTNKEANLKNKLFSILFYLKQYLLLSVFYYLFIKLKNNKKFI